jgi:hypothetical protein
MLALPSILTLDIRDNTLRVDLDIFFANGERIHSASFSLYPGVSTAKPLLPPNAFQGSPASKPLPVPCSSLEQSDISPRVAPVPCRDISRANGATLHGQVQG